MIRNFKHKGLAELFEKGSSRRIGRQFQAKALRELDALSRATRPEAMNIPGFDFHKLKGNPVRYSVHVNGNFCITFGWDGDNAIDVNFEDYH